MKRHWPALISVPVLGAAVLGVLWLSQGLEQAAPVTADDRAGQPRYELRGAQWTRLGPDGQRLFTAEADRIQWFDDRSAHLEKPRISGLGGPGSPWNLQSPEGQMAPHSEDLLLMGPVTATGRAPDGDPLRLETDRLLVATRTHQLETTSPVMLKGTTRQIKAVGMTADWNGRSLQLLKNVEVNYAPPRR